MNDEHHGLYFLISLPLGIQGLVMSQYYSDPVTKTTLFGIGMALGLIATYNGLICAVSQIILLAQKLQDVILMTAPRAMARELHNLPPEAIGIVDRTQRMDADVVIAAEGLKYYLRGTDITFEFLEEFLEKCDGMYLAPVRIWSEGSIGRTMAQDLTRYFCQANWALEFNGGNKPARWINGMTTWRVRSVFFGTAEDKELFPSPALLKGGDAAKNALAHAQKD